MAIWKAQRTLLIVGEGYHEEAFLNHVKQLYAPRGCGLSVTVKNAHGKGAKHVIDWTIRQIANTAYDSVAAMLDTDTDWTAAVERQAKAKKIRVLASEPCFDAVMLRLLGKNPVGDAKALKKYLAPMSTTIPPCAKTMLRISGPSVLRPAVQMNHRSILYLSYWGTNQ